VTDESEVPAAPPPAAQPLNGNGRPLTPDKLREHMLKKETLHGTRTASDKQRSLVAMTLNTCFAGLDKPDTLRHSVIKFFFGTDSVKTITGAQVHALLDWLKPTQDSGGDYLPDGYAVTEAQMVLTEAMRAAGQMEMPTGADQPAGDVPAQETLF